MARSSIIDKISVGWVDKKHSDLVWWPRVVLFVTLVGVICVLILQTTGSAAWNSGYSLRFYGHGVDDIDRVKVPIDPPVPADVGATDFTIEWWMKAAAADNTPGDCGDWICGNIIFDRDIYQSGSIAPGFGISLYNGNIWFGSGDPIITIKGTVNVADNVWHHIAVTRVRDTGEQCIFVDGALDVCGNTASGAIAYPDGFRNEWPNNPYLVIGAEKHDYDQIIGQAPPQYPSYNGWIDEVRLSDVVRYTSGFEPPSVPFTSDGNTVALYHLDEGPVGACTGTVLDSSGASGGPSYGTCNYGGAGPAGPVYTTDVPFAPDTTPPSISNVAASALVTETVITWNTDEPATSQVTYGISPTLNLSTTESTQYVISHEVALASLSPDTVYAYVVRSTDEAGNPGVSEVFSFRTLASQYPNPVYLPLVLRSSGLTTWGCGAAKAPPSEPVSALRAPEQSPGAPATAEFTDTQVHLFRYLSVGVASSVVLLIVVIIAVRCMPQARRRQGESGKGDNRMSARGPI